MLLPLLLSALALADPPALDALVDAALASHPAVVAARAGTDAAEAQARVAGSWSDPTLSVEYSNAPVDSFDVSQAMMGGVQFGLRQTFPTSGMPARRQAVARHDAARADALAGEV
ncbi:MAG: TolC family protein, partial [Myxococcales bacterium]|nr:TolC family protein [Myxococcales bacterium]